MNTIGVNRIATLTGHRDSVFALEGTTDDRFFFSASGDGMIVQWTFGERDGERIAQLDSSVYALRLDPTSGFLLAGHNFDGLHVLDWRSRKEVRSLNLTTATIFDIAVVDGLALVACGDGSVHVVELEPMRKAHEWRASDQSARCVAVRPDSKEMAVGYSDNAIRVYGIPGFNQVAEFTAHNNSVFSLRYTPDGRRLISGSRDARLKSWNTAQNYALMQDVPAHLFAINDIGFSPDGKHFVTCSMDKSVKVWRSEDLTLLKVIDKARHGGHAASVNKLFWSPFNNQVVSASDDRTISIWDVIF